MGRDVQVDDLIERSEKVVDLIGVHAADVGDAFGQFAARYPNEPDKVALVSAFAPIRSGIVKGETRIHESVFPQERRKVPGKVHR
jgi:hypothetical protein